MDTPTHYANISEKALEVKTKYNLTDTQTLLYDHICRGDFKLINGDGQKFYDPNNNGFGWRGDREWVKRQFKTLIKEGLVKFESIHDCRDKKYTSWYFYNPQCDLNELIDACCYVSTHQLALIKHYLNLEDGFDKKNKTYGDIEFIYDKKKGYTFKYKGESSIYSWSHVEDGKKFDLSWMSQHIIENGEIKFVTQSTWIEPLYYESFQEMLHDIWSFLAHDGCKYIEVPNYNNIRRFTI